MEEAQTGTARIGHVAQTRTQEAPISLPGMVLLVVNNKANGMMQGYGYYVARPTPCPLRLEGRIRCGECPFLPYQTLAALWCF